jgi:hypothetical protein
VHPQQVARWHINYGAAWDLISIALTATDTLEEFAALQQMYDVLLD